VVHNVTLKKTYEGITFTATLIHYEVLNIVLNKTLK